MDRLEENLLVADATAQDGLSAGAWQRLQARVSIVLVVAGLAASAFIGGTAFGRQTTHSHGAYGVSLTSANEAAQNPTALAAGLNPDCYTYTGGTCGINPCYAWRGAECRDGYCLCEGACSGADGKCYEGRYEQVADGFTLTNVKYSAQKMYMPASSPFDSVKTTAFPSSMNMGKDKFILHRLPGNVSGHTGYFLSTQRFSDYVVALRATTGTALSPWGAYEVGLSKQFSVEKLAVRVCSKGDGKVMIGGLNLLGQTEWFYIHHLSWIVYGWGLFSNPGNGGVWQADPPMPEGELEPCE